MARPDPSKMTDAVLATELRNARALHNRMVTAHTDNPLEPQQKDWVMKLQGERDAREHAKQKVKEQRRRRW